MSRRNLIILAVLVVAAVLVGRRLARKPPTDEERIEALFSKAALAAEEKRVADVVEPLSERFAGQGLDKRGVRRFVTGMVLRGDWVSVSLGGVRTTVQGDTATSVVDVVTARSGKGKALADLLPNEAGAHRITAFLEREDGEWRVVRAEWEQISLADALAGPDR